MAPRKKTRAQAVNPKQIAAFIESAARKIEAARQGSWHRCGGGLRVAYEGMIKSSLCLMLSYGERPRSQPGHHVIIIEYCSGKIDKAHGPILDVFDRMRRKRNQAFYDVGTITIREAEDAVTTAEKYLVVIESEVMRYLNLPTTASMRQR